MRYLIHPGHGGKDPGAIGYGLKESQMNLRAAFALASGLVDGKSKDEVLFTRSLDVDCPPAIRRIKYSTIPHDYLIVIHHNAGGGRGFESFIKTKYSILEVRIQDNIQLSLDRLFKNYGIPVRMKQYKDWGDLLWTKSPSIFLEIGFIDSVEDMEFLTNPYFMADVMLRIGREIRNAF